MKIARFSAVLCAASFALPANADIAVRFIESAPKDRFVISNASCPVSNIAVVIDLSGSAGGLIFDVTSSGAGVEVFQPVEVVMGDAKMEPVVDGDTTLSFEIGMLTAGQDLVISADLDDVLRQSDMGQIRVSGSELDGAVLQMSVAGEPLSAIFSGGSNTVTLPHECLS